MEAAIHKYFVQKALYETVKYAAISHSEIHEDKKVSELCWNKYWKKKISDRSLADTTYSFNVN